MKLAKKIFNVFGHILKVAVKTVHPFQKIFAKLFRIKINKRSNRFVVFI